MPLQFRRDAGRLVWVRNPFNDTVTYFTHVHRKRIGFIQRQQDAVLRAPIVDRAALEAELRHELEAAKRECPFCPGNEHLTTEELLRVPPTAVPGSTRSEPWLIRAFTNLVPRIPECCTGDRNESYVVVEDPRHFADAAQGHDDLLCTAMLPVDQLRLLLETCIEMARLSFENRAVQAVLVRKNQGRDSGASQPHVHTQVIGSDLPFAPIVREAEVTHRDPGLWRDILAFVEGEGFLIRRLNGFAAYFCPFGTFPRSYEIVAPDVRSRLVDLAPDDIATLAVLLHEVLQTLGPVPLDYEIHADEGVPLHVHVNSRHFTYSNIGGTLNLPSTLLADRPTSSPG